MEPQFASLKLGEEPNEVMPDWASLPDDVLHRTYQKLFEADADSPWPLTKAVSQVQTLRLVAKNWAQVLANRPPALQLKIENIDEYCHAEWVTAFPVKTLHMHLVVPPSHETSLSDVDQDEEHLLTRSVLMTDCIHGSVEGLCFGKMVDLKSLTIECQGYSWGNGAGIFNADPLQKLEHLSHLKLTGFLGFELRNLPLSVRNITLGYVELEGDSNEPDANEIQFSLVPELPENINLDRLRLTSYNAIGVANLDALWDCCRYIEIDAGFCLLGVPVSDPEVINAFERPYREGRYVPPHILADPEAQEASSKAADKTMEYLLSGIASSSKLEVLSFSRQCAESVHLVPGRAGNLRSSVEFLHSVVKHKIQYLPGVCGRELLDRFHIMQGRGTLPGSAIKLDVHEEDHGFNDGESYSNKWDFRVVVEERMSPGRRVVVEEQ